MWKTLWKNIKNVMNTTYEWLYLICYMAVHITLRLILYIYHGVVSWYKHTFQRRNDMTDKTNNDDTIVINANASADDDDTIVINANASTDDDGTATSKDVDTTKTDDDGDGKATDTDKADDAGDTKLAEKLAALTAAKAADDAKLIALQREHEVNELAKSTGVAAELLADTGLTGDRLTAYAAKLKSAGIGINPAAAAVRQQAIGAQLTSKKVDPWDQLAQQISKSLGY
jgi:hypothetical protein